MIVDDITMPDLPSGFHSAAYGVIVKSVGYTENEDGTVDSDELVTSYIAITSDKKFVHVPNDLATEYNGGDLAFDSIYTQGTVISAWSWSEGESGWTTNDAAEDITDVYAIPMYSLMNIGIFTVWSNHYIMTATALNEDTGEATLGDTVYFASCVHQGEEEYSVPANGILAAANLVRSLGPKTMHTTDTMYDFITSPAAGWMEKIVMPGGEQDSLGYLALLVYGITSYTEKFDIFPFQLQLLTQKAYLPNATEIGYMAFASNLLKELNAPKLQKIGDSALYNYLAESVSFPLVTDIGAYAFDSADMTEALFPSAVRIGVGAFESCANLTSFTIPATVKNLGKSGEEGNPFPGCTALATVTVDSGNEYYCVVNNNEIYTKGMSVLVTPANGVSSYSVAEGVKEIASDAFRANKSLTSITLPSTLEVIGNNAFRNCKVLPKLDIPASVTAIGSNIVDSCDEMTTLILRKSDAIYEDLILFTQMQAGTGYTYVPSALLETYKASENHSAYAAQFRAIEDYPDICG